MSKSAIVYDLNKQAVAAKVLADNLRATFGNDEDLIGTAIEGETDFNEVMENAIERLVTLDAHATGLDAVMKRLKERRERFVNQHAAVKAALALALQTSGMKTYELAVATLSNRKLPDACEITDEAKIPAKYWTRPPPPDPKLDTQKILEALLGKEDVPGAKLRDEKTTISIRYK